MQKVKTTIIILDYLKAPQVVVNVNSLYRQKTDFDYRVIVIDNSCQEKNAVVLKQLAGRNNLRLVINRRNLGYAKAHNAVRADILGDYVVIVNPDIFWPREDILQKLVDFMDRRPDIGILGAKQENKRGEIGMTVRPFPKLFLQVARRTYLRHLPLLKEKVAWDERRNFNYSKIQDVDWLRSSFIVVRKNLWDAVGGFCENYFLFMADVEICWQAWRRGYRVVYFPEAEVIEDGKRASRGGVVKFFQSWILRQHVKDALKFKFKHLFEPNPRLKRSFY